MGESAVVVILGITLSVMASGPIMTYDEYYSSLLGANKAKDLEKQHLSGSLMRHGNNATMTCSLEHVNKTCVKWIRQDRPFDEIQTLRSFGCEKNDHTIHDDRQTFSVTELGSDLTFTFKFTDMMESDMGVYYCFEITSSDPYHKWRTFVIQD